MTLMRKCGYCDRYQPVGDFASKNRNMCKSCYKQWHKEYYVRNKERKLNSATEYYKANKDRIRAYRQNNRGRFLAYERQYNLRTLYGITPAQFGDLLTIQGGRCPICGTDTPGGKNGTWHVDHCHTSGKIRGILCARCNLMLGHARDNPEVLTAAAAYLRNSNA